MPSSSATANDILPSNGICEYQRNCVGKFHTASEMGWMKPKNSLMDAKIWFTRNSRSGFSAVQQYAFEDERIAMCQLQFVFAGQSLPLVCVLTLILEAWQVVSRAFRTLALILTIVYDQ